MSVGERQVYIYIYNGGGSRARARVCVCVCEREREGERESTQEKRKFELARDYREQFLLSAPCLVPTVRVHSGAS